MYAVCREKFVLSRKNSPKSVVEKEEQIEAENSRAHMDRAREGPNPSYNGTKNSQTTFMFDQTALVNSKKNPGIEGDDANSNTEGGGDTNCVFLLALWF